MARIPLVKPANLSDPAIVEIFDWVTQMEGAVPNHFLVEMNFPELFKAKLATTQVLWQMGELTLPEVQHVGILVSRANGCPYCTAAFCTILNYGLGTAEDYVRALAEQGLTAVREDRLKTLLAFALKVNSDPKAVTDDEIAALPRRLAQTMRIEVSHFRILTLETHLFKHRFLGWLQQTVQTAQDEHRQDDIAVFAAHENIPEAVVSD